MTLNFTRTKMWNVGTAHLSLQIGWQENRVAAINSFIFSMVDKFCYILASSNKCWFPYWPNMIHCILYSFKYFHRNNYTTNEKYSTPRDFWKFIGPEITQFWRFQAQEIFAKKKFPEPETYFEEFLFSLFLLLLTALPVYIRCT